jgi:hypothetical protein
MAGPFAIQDTIIVRHGRRSRRVWAPPSYYPLVGVKGRSKTVNKTSLPASATKATPLRTPKISAPPSDARPTKQGDGSKYLSACMHERLSLSA